MPKPNNTPRTRLPLTVWSKIEAEANARAALGQHVFAIHIGDTHLPFPKELTEPIHDEEHLFASRLNIYSDTYGEKPLRELIARKALLRNLLPVEGIENVQVTSGATSGLQAAFSRLLDPGAEVLVPAPYWSILRQVADQARVKLVEAPFFDKMAQTFSSADLNRHYCVEPGFDPAEILEPFITPKTQGIYLNTPSNPTGMLLDRGMLERIAEFAHRHDLWVFSDEAYEDFIWEGDNHVSIGSLPGMFERTVSIYTFSKCFGVSGIRVGYVVAEPAVVSQINRGIVGAYYQPGRLGQLFAWRGIMRFEEALHGFRHDYAPTWRWVRDHLKCDFMPSVGGFYFFVKLPSGWEGLPPELKIDRMLDNGVVLSPGEYFGHDYRGWARLCFTILPPEQIEESIHRLNQMF